MKKVGITGGIGSGKTTVCALFKTLGIPVYNADERAKWLMNHDADVMRSVKELIGDEAYDSEQMANSKLIASIVFRDKKLLDALNQIIHPAVAKDGESWYAAQQAHAYVLKESALMFETEIYKDMDKNILVISPEALRIERVRKRDHSSVEAIKERMNHQMSDEEKIPLADYIIHNDTDHSLIEQVIAIHKKLLNDEI